MMDVDIANRINKFKSNVTRLTDEHSYEERTIARLHGKIEQIEKDKAELLKVQGLIDRAITVISANGIGKIETIVSGGLQLVFENKNVRLVIDKKETARGNNYKIKIKKTTPKGEIVGDALTTFGGGLVNVAAFLLRVLMIKRFKLAKFLVADESFNNVSPQYQPKVSEMLQKLCHDHGYTILAVTHQATLASAADHVYEVIPQHDAAPVLHTLSKEEISEIKEGSLVRFQNPQSSQG